MPTKFVTRRKIYTHLRNDAASGRHEAQTTRRNFHSPTTEEVSAYMRSLAARRWQKYRSRVARGEITAENHVYRPRGPMPPESKAKQDLTR
jgi:hypothetical protein